jgi:hypothetical protein
MLGYSVSGAADIDGDRLCDFVIGEPPGAPKRHEARPLRR